MTTALAAMPISNAASAAAPSAADPDSSDFSFSFHDLVSIVNPLQHIPVVSTIYRALTGDTIKPAERIAGDTLYGGLWGFVSSVANVAFQELTGKDFGETALALLEGKDVMSDMADNTPAPATPYASVDSAAIASSVASNYEASNDPSGAQSVPTPFTPVNATAVAASVAANNPISLADTNTQTIASPFAPVDTAAIAAKVAADNPVSIIQPKNTAGIAQTKVSAPSAALVSGLTPSQPGDTSAAALALMTSMNAKGIDSALGQRAFAAYQRSLATSPNVLAPAF
jgi:hypothetical protein